MAASWLHHLTIVPIVLPLVAGALMVLFDERRHALKATVSLGSAILLLAVSLTLLAITDATTPSVYLLGNWPAPFGIVLVLDRLSALMLVLTSILAIASLTFALARWQRGGAHFHTIFQLLLMGVNGAFLTGDLFNLFVFFEVMLASSYGLLLHGSGPQRVKAGLHYIAFNLATSALFLIGVSLLYGVTGTLNMADMARRISLASPEDRVFIEAGAAILGLAFLVKAGMWPLGFWLSPAYAAAAAPVAAMFAILSKVGIYVLLRLSLLLSGAGALAGFGAGWLIAGGMATMGFGLIGMLASQALGRLAGYSVLISSGTLIAAIGIGGTGLIGSALFYLVSSTLAVAAFCLLIELIERGQDPAAAVLAVTMEAYGDDDEEAAEEEVGLAIPAMIAILGACFAICAIVLIGLPPFSGFVAKFLLIANLLNRDGIGTLVAIPAAAWGLVALIILASLAALVALTRTGIHAFWVSLEPTVPRVRLTELAPIAGLLLLCLGLTVGAGPVMRYMQATAQYLAMPQDYIGRVLTAPQVPPAEGQNP
jgi:multicomponent K+:H+ antiporter subunit D